MLAFCLGTRHRDRLASRACQRAQTIQTHELWSAGDDRAVVGDGLVVIGFKADNWGQNMQLRRDE